MSALGDLGPVTHSSHAKVQSHECARIRVHFTALVIADCKIVSGTKKIASHLKKCPILAIVTRLATRYRHLNCHRTDRVAVCVLFTQI